ncbi:Proteasome subunit beta type-5 [Penicillium subrubescens]|uniref:proteasome endopeptidase complex n=1 Tax=Penicillium subrubescens TaxID=1316194 RepID=A0A1Q5UGZ5_9EURO|nr:Proteasome subunit beta type-5 [Penicillium subrubescens]
MDKIVAQYSRPSYQNVYTEQDQQELTESLPPLSLKFALPPVANVSYSNTNKVIHGLEAGCHELGVSGQSSGGPRSPSSQLWRPELPAERPSAFLRAMTDDHSNPSCPIKLAHGTTTLAFRFQGGIIVCTDSRATAGNWIASQTVKKVIPVSRLSRGEDKPTSEPTPGLLGTMAGGAADCQYWLRYLSQQCTLHEIRHKRRITVAAASKILANLTYSYKGYGLSMGTMLAGVTPQEGPALYYIDSDGTRLPGNLFCVGSGQTFAYGVLDANYRYDLTEQEALALGRRAILAAMHRDAYSGGFINLYHVKEEGWVHHGFDDMNPIFWKTKLESGEFSNVTSEL